MLGQAIPLMGSAQQNHASQRTGFPGLWTATEGEAKLVPLDQADLPKL